MKISPEKVFEINKTWHKYEASIYHRRHDEIFRDEIELWQGIAKKYLVDSKYDILDFGAGTGFVSSIIQDYISPNSKITLADPSPEMLRISKDNINHNYSNFVLIKDSKYEINGFKNKFDFILLNSVLHHIPDLSILFNKLNHYLKLDGKIIIAHEPNNLYYNSKSIYLINKFLDTIYSYKIIVKNNKRIASTKISGNLVSKVNKELLSNDIIKKELTASELQKLVDYHSPTAGSIVNKEIGFSKNRFMNLTNQFDNYSIDDYSTYKYLGKRKILGNPFIDKVLSKLLPNCGSKIFIVLSKNS